MTKIHECWNEITGMYAHFENKKPIMELEPNSGRIIAYPAEDYIGNLSYRTRDKTMKQYRKAVATGALMVFVRDELNKFLKSYIFPKLMSKVFGCYQSRCIVRRANHAERHKNALNQTGLWGIFFIVFHLRQLSVNSSFNGDGYGDHQIFRW